MFVVLQHWGHDPGLLTVTHLDLGCRCCTGGSCRPFWSQAAARNNKEHHVCHYYLYHTGQKNKNVHPGNYCTVVSEWDPFGHRGFSYKQNTHNFAKAFLELDVGLTWMMDVGLAIFTPQSKLVIHWKISKGKTVWLHQLTRALYVKTQYRIKKNKII